MALIGGLIGLIVGLSLVGMLWRQYRKQSYL